jgi:hypothetical protein
VSPTYETAFTYTVTYKGTTSTGVATSCAVYRSGWYDDARAARVRAGLVATYQLAGIAEWTVGGEDPAQWPSLRSYARSIAATPTIVRVSTPTSATYGSTVTVTASATAAGVGVAGAPASLFFRTPSGPWSKVAASVTSGSGAVGFHVATTRAGYFKTVVGGTFDRAAGSGVSKAVALRTAMTVVASATTVSAGKRVAVVAALRPVVRGQLVKRQLKRAGRWVTVETDTTGRAGNARFSFNPTIRGKVYHYRLKAMRTSGVLGTTRYLDVTVR